MRRLFSILLLATFALPMVAPLLALAQDPGAGLPACCRRHGQHHCAMLDREQDPTAHRLVAVCPLYPQHPAAYLTATHPLALQPPVRAWMFSEEPAPSASAETHHPIARNHSHCQRGPPLESPAIS
jgi:hypothetical protein